MANKKITDLTLRSGFDETCNIPVHDASQTWRSTGAQLIAWVYGAGGATYLHALTEKTVPLAADEITVYDTAASALKKVLRQKFLQKIYRAAVATDTILAGDEFLIYSGASFTGTLPAASAALAGKTIVVKHNDATLGRIYTITDGTLTKKLNTIGECCVFICTGTAWILDRRYIPSEWVSFTPGSSISTNVAMTGYWRRVGDSIQVCAQWIFSGANTQGAITSTLPTGLAFDTTKMLNVALEHVLGKVKMLDASASNYIMGGEVCYNDSTTVALKYIDTSAGVGAVNQRTFTPSGNDPVVYANGDKIVAVYEGPIANWEG